MLDTFIKRSCSFCFKETYGESEKITFKKDEITFCFCNKCRKMTNEEKAVFFITKIICKNGSMTLEEIVDSFKNKK